MDANEIPGPAVLLRLATPADQPAVAALLASAGQPAEDVSSPASRCVAVAAGPPEAVIGYGDWWPNKPGKFRMRLLVAPPWRGQGVGGRLLGEIAGRARADGAVTLQARVEADSTRSLEFLLARGFAETMRMHKQVLDVADANLTGYQDAMARLAGQGIALVSLDDELARRTDCWDEYCRVRNAAQEGWLDPDPGPDPDPAMTPAEFQRRYLEYEIEHEVRRAEGFLASYQDRYVGFTGAIGTGVDPAFRRLGIATALKLQATATARDHGIATLHTGSGNAAMLRINERIGYRLTSSEIRLVRPLEPAMAGSR